ncbi:hypothetical protein [Yoonia sp. 208BN28-4]|uniref:hypothetical protein n=1 Tax=Yoonia sp. 208BN28-4 TaxID=3126505 RepID=UPI0030ABAEB2
MAGIVSGAIVNALGGAAALGTIGVGLVQVGVGLGFSALAQALQAPANTNAKPPGIQTQTTTRGETIGQTFIVGRYATNGHREGILYSHRRDGKSGPGSMRTGVYSLSDMPLAMQDLRTVIVDGTRVSLTNGDVDPDYGVTPAGGQYAGRIYFKYYDGTQTAADPMMLDKYGNNDEFPWLSTHIFRDTAYVIVSQVFDREVFKSQETDLRFIIDAGIPLYDISMDSTAGGIGPQRWDDRTTWQPSSNPKVIQYNVHRGITVKGGYRYGGRADAEDLPAANWIPAIVACYQPRSSLFLDPFTGEEYYRDYNVGDNPNEFRIHRFQMGFEINLASTDQGGTEPAELIEMCDLVCGGATVDVGGTVLTRVGLPQLPSRFITDRDIYVTRSQGYDPFPSLDSMINAVTASYPSLADNFEPREAVPFRDAGAEARHGRYKAANLNLSGVTNETQAQDLMQGYLTDAQRLVRHTITVPPAYLAVNPLEAIDWASDYNGYAGKDFDVAEVAIDPETLSVTFALREIDPTDMSLVESAEVPVTAPSTVPIVYAPEAVPGWDAIGGFVADSQGAPRRPCGILSWSELEPDITGIQYRIYVAATGELVEQGTISDTAARQHIARAANFPATDYEAEGRLIADRPTEWTARVAFTTPAVGFTQTDFDASVQRTLDQVGDVTSEVAAQGRQSLEDIIAQTEALVTDFDLAEIDRDGLAREIEDRRADREALIAVADNLRASLQDTQAQIAAVQEVLVKADSAEARQRNQIAAAIADPDTGLPGSFAAIDIERVARVAADEAEAEARQQLAVAIADPVTGLTAIAASVTQEAGARAAGDAAEALARQALASVVNDPATGLAATSAAVSQEAQTRANADSAQASTINALTGRVDDAEGDITSLQTVKVDGDGAVAAVDQEISATYGSIGAMALETAFAVAGVEGVQSGFIWRARAGGASGEVELVAANNPIGGNSSQFTVNADRFRFLGGLSMFGGVLQSTNYATGVSGWRITESGDIEADSLTVRREMIVQGAVSGAVTEKQPDGSENIRETSGPTSEIVTGEASFSAGRFLDWIIQGGEVRNPIKVNATGFCRPYIIGSDGAAGAYYFMVFDVEYKVGSTWYALVNRVHYANIDNPGAPFTFTIVVDDDVSLTHDPDQWVGLRLKASISNILNDPGRELAWEIQGCVLFVEQINR